MLPEQAGEAALLFEPHSIPAIANAIREMATDENLRAELVHKGKQRLQDFSWERTAKAYRAVYRCAASCSLTDEDRWLLSCNWMQKPIQSMMNE
jgi:glycosyltransferase involved in cell wall biosynthesis